MVGGCRSSAALLIRSVRVRQGSCPWSCPWPLHSVRTVLRYKVRFSAVLNVSAALIVEALSARAWSNLCTTDPLSSHDDSLRSRFGSNFSTLCERLYNSLFAGLRVLLYVGPAPTVTGCQKMTTGPHPVFGVSPSVMNSGHEILSGPFSATLDLWESGTARTGSWLPGPPCFYGHITFLSAATAPT